VPDAAKTVLTFAHDWEVEVLTAPPLIAPVRQFVYPRQVAGEEDTLARGALLLMVRPHSLPTLRDNAAKDGAPGHSSPFLATCARGFADAAMPTGVWSCPNPAEMCAVAGGYAYMVNVQRPEQCVQISFRPVAEVRALPEDGLLLFTGFHALQAWGSDGLMWETKRLTWEGVRIAEIAKGKLHGFGWEMRSDKELPFTVDLKTGEHTGGAWLS
jgi:hypothetical protein